MLASDLIVGIDKIRVPDRVGDLLTHSTDIRYPRYG